MHFLLLLIFLDISNGLFRTLKGIRLGENEDEKDDAEQYDDTGLYQGTFYYFFIFIIEKKVSKIAFVCLSY